MNLKRLSKDMLDKVYIVWIGKGSTMQVVMEFHETNNLFLLHDNALRFRLDVSDFAMLFRTLRDTRHVCCFKTSRDMIENHNYDLMREVAETIHNVYHHQCL